ncbi:MarR family transcriptional regulator [Gemmatimonas sp.]|jgi:MarR family 2-MHQ and catechol resistance regulon transcriptional repressor|uniref:MarR family winged helix-turn-helix transcriptional regulator n=1 Tax=Gemmatimonas sp. TaxID=1962908 RepID=UPI0022C8C059|nr:MarR family transcriptional regulator [Gemmatimonas sp.]MCZ8205713.1 MarR family transcriptional regulator [Gemmatimonas sp.]
MATTARPARGSRSLSQHPEAHEPALDERTAAALRLWVIMARAHTAVAAHAAADVSRQGLTLAEFGILEALYHRGPMLLGEVQKRILVSSGGITFLVDRLVAKDLVERRSCESDRRARYAALTPKGVALVAEIFPAHAAVLARAMEGISIEEQQQVADLLRDMGRHAAMLPVPYDD